MSFERFKLIQGGGAGVEPEEMVDMAASALFELVAVPAPTIDLDPLKIAAAIYFSEEDDKYHIPDAILPQVHAAMRTHPAFRNRQHLVDKD